ncbi:MAG: PSD1 and planctomycete cytochrome C domain-containing protein [Chthoniobacteraceae bacterium]
MSIRTHVATGFLTVIAAPLWAAVTAEPTQKQLDFFESKIRPILADHCYKCHSIEAGKAKGELTLDTKGGWEKGGETGKAIVPGTPEKSLLYTALTYKDDLRMPPTSSGGKLSEQQIADIAEWIKMGAPDPRKEAKKAGGKLSGLTDSARSHWAYQPVTNPKVPVNKNQQWCRTPIDCFILQKLESKAMLPSPDADRETLLRRVSYDLTGLPPTFAEVTAFENDTAPNAFEKVVDRLLASPAYGERWARHWLDTARYSDTIGGDRNAARTTEYRYPDAWTYRDYVIRSLNEDKPYTDFITEQLAADKIPGIHPNDPRLAALGFLTVGERFKNVNDIINDRIDVVSKGFLALTVACARCHDHMFDPIPTKDYYALHGVFTSITEPDQKPLLGTKVTPAQREDYQSKYNALLAELRNRYLDATGYYLDEIQRAPAAYIRAAMLAGGKKDQATLIERNELIKKHNLDEQFVGYFTKGMQRNPAVWGPLLSFRSGGTAKFKKMTVAGANAAAAKLEAKLGKEAGEKAAMLAKTFASRLKSGANPYVEKAFTEKQPKNLDEAIEVYAQLFASVAPKAKGFIPAMKAASSQTVPGYEDPALVDLLRGPFEVAPAPLIDLEWAESAQKGWPNKMLGRARLNYGEINLLETSHPGAPAHAMVVQDKGRPVNSAVFIRGQSEVKGEIVPRGFLEILSPGHKPVEFSQGSGRYELAKCIADRQNPLTARVLVNRVWLHHFGEGFVRTPDDLGVMAEKPTHPELIDYLANWFMDSGWSLKKLHKFIVMSRVYQVSSHTRPEYEIVDPENRMLWRANVRRLDFEAMRDSLLVYSGDLERRPGGKPINLTEEPYSFRRSVYGYVDRGNLPELMAHFDFSDPDMPNSKRATSLVPQQALFFMNSPMAVDVARKILTRPEVVRQPGDLYRINAIYRVIFQRMPNPREVRMTLAFVEMENKLQTETAADAGSLVNASASDTASKTGKTKKPGAKKKNDSNFGAIQNEGTGVVRSVLSPWETFVQALLFSNEAAYVN